MWAVSSRWLPALTAGYEQVSRAEVFSDGAPVLVDGAPLVLTLTGGSVSLSESSKVRRNLTLRAADLGLLPRAAGDALSPFGVELQVSTGPRYTEGDVELVPVGRFVLDTVASEGWGSGLSLRAGDRATAVQGAQFTSAWTANPGALVTDEIARLLWSVNPSWVVINLTGSGALVPAGLSWTDDRWDAIGDLATSIGAEVAFDPIGRAVIRKVPDGSALSAWTIDPTRNMVDVSRSLSRQGVSNVVVASSSDPMIPPVSGTAWVANGPLRRRPDYQVVRKYASPVLQTVDACMLAAQTVLTRSVTVAQEIVPTVYPNPALDVGDVLTVIDPDSSEPLTRVASGTTIPLGPSDQGMSVTTRVPDTLSVAAGMTILTGVA